MYFFVGSENPVKIKAATAAGQAQWPDLVVAGLAVPSGVPAQPRSDEETRLGAENRAKQAWIQGRARLQLTDTEVALGLGLEGGVVLIGRQLWSTVWVAVTDDAKQCFVANGARFPLPKEIATPIMEGAEMGVVMAQLSQNPHIKQQQGMIGMVTQNFVDRTKEYASLAQLAVGLWYGRNWLNQVTVSVDSKLQKSTN